MPVPEDVRAKNELVNSGNLLKYMVGKFENTNGIPIQVFLHEAVYVLGSGSLIPTGNLVSHKDGNPMNNEFENLELVPENSQYGDLHTIRVFHEENKGTYTEFIKGHFPDVYAKLNLDLNK